MASLTLLSRSHASDVDRWKACIPKEPGLLVESTREDENGIMDIVRKSYLWKDNTPDLYLPIEVNLVDNEDLVQKYLAKKETMKAKGRSSRECQDIYAFAIERLSNLTNICLDGPISRPAKRHLLGDSRLGFRVWQHADVCLHFGTHMNQNPLVLVVYKVMLGRRKMVHLQHYTDVHNALKPTPGYDCHMSYTQPSQMDVAQVAANLDQVYLYDCDDDMPTQRHVSHCLPYAVVIIARQLPPHAAPEDNMTLRRSLFDPSADWGCNDFGVTHWRKLLSRRSIEQDDVSLKSSENHIEIGSHDRRPNLVVRRVVTHGFPLSVKKAVLQWKARRNKRLRSTSRNVLARPPQVRRLLSDRFSEICGNVKCDEGHLSDMTPQGVLSEKGGKLMKDRMKDAFIQNNEILKQLSHLWRGTQPCNQGALMETGVATLVPVDVRSTSVLNELTDGEMVADTMGNLSPVKKRKTSREAGDADGEFWQSQVVEGSKLKVNFRRITSPASKTLVPCSHEGLVASDGYCGDVKSCSVIEAGASSQGSVSVERLSDCRGSSDGATVASPFAVKQCFVDLGSRVTLTNSCAQTLEKAICDETHSKECADVQRDKLTVSDINVNVKDVTTVPTAGSDIRADVESVTTVPVTGSGVRADVKSVTKALSILCDIVVDVKSVTKAPPTGSDINANVKSITKALTSDGDIDTDVKCVIKAPLTDSDVSTNVKNVTTAPSTLSNVTKVTTSDGHACIEKLAALMTLESYWRVAEALSTAKRTKSHHRQKTSTRNSTKSVGMKVPRRQTKWSDNFRSRNGVVVKTKHRTKHAKILGESVRISSRRGVVHAGGWISLARVVRSSHSGSSLMSPVKRQDSREGDRSDCGAHVCHKPGECTHQADVELTWSTNTEPLFSTREQPAFDKGLHSLVPIGVALMADRPKAVGTKAKVSGIETTPYGKEMKQHGMKVKLPENEVNVSGSKVNVFDKEVHEKKMKVNDAKCKERKPGMQQKLPENVKVSDTECKEARTEVKLPAVWVKQPVTEVKLPGMEVKLPGTEVKLTGTEVKLPRTEVKLPGTKVILPGMEVTLCETATSPCPAPSAAYYTDICQPNWGTGNEHSVDGVTQTGHFKIPVSSRHSHIMPDRTDESGKVIKASRWDLGSSVTAEVQKLTTAKPLFHGTCSEECVDVTTVSDINANVKGVTKALATTSGDVKCVTKVNTSRSDIHTAVNVSGSGLVKCVTNVTAGDGHCFEKLAELMTLDSYWSMVKASDMAKQTKTSDRNLASSNFPCRSSQRYDSSEKIKLANTEEKVFAKQPNLLENKMKVCETRKWKAFGKEVKPDTQLTQPKRGVTVFGKEGKSPIQLKLSAHKMKVSDTMLKVFGKEGKPGTQLKLPEREVKVSDTKGKVLNKDGKPGTQLKLPENVNVLDMECKETRTVKLPALGVKQHENKMTLREVQLELPGQEVKLPGTKVKLLGTEMKLPGMGVKLHGMSPSNTPYATYYTGICQPFSTTAGDSYVQQAVDNASRLPFPRPCCDDHTKNGHKTDKLVHVSVNMDLQKLSRKCHSERINRSCDITRSLPKQPLPVGSVTESCRVGVSTSTHAPVRGPLQDDTDVKNGDTVSKTGSGETENKTWSVSLLPERQGEEKRDLSWSGKKLGRFEETVGSGGQQKRPSGAVKFHGRTLLWGVEVPVRFIPLHPLYLFHPIRKSGKREVIPVDPRPTHYMRKETQLTGQRPTAPWKVTRRIAAPPVGGATEDTTRTDRPKCGAHGTGSVAPRVQCKQLRFVDRGATCVRIDDDMDLDSS